MIRLFNLCTQFMSQISDTDPKSIYILRDIGQLVNSTLVDSTELWSEDKRYLLQSNSTIDFNRLEQNQNSRRAKRIVKTKQRRNKRNRKRSKN